VSTSDQATSSAPIPLRVETLDYDGVRRPTKFRWVVCGLLFFATTINYMDRQIIGVLKPELTKHLGWSETDYGNIIFSFQAAYALGYLCAGRVIDLIGVRWGLGLAVFFWSIFAAGHAMARSVMGFCVARFGLGLAEGGNFPPPSRRSANGFRRRSGRWRRACSTPAAASAHW
jgi:ACS family hexuronate transporter-like MFS transporter